MSKLYIEESMRRRKSHKENNFFVIFLKYLTHACVKNFVPKPFYGDLSIVFSCSAHALAMAIGKKSISLGFI